MNIAFCETESQWSLACDQHLKKACDVVVWYRNFPDITDDSVDSRARQKQIKEQTIRPMFNELQRKSQSPVSMNLSHSGKYVAAAMSVFGQVGIDIEHQNLVTWSKDRCLKISNRFFYADESAWLSNLAPQKTAEAFLKMWTFKESICKCTTTGIKNNLSRVIVNPENWTLKAHPWKLEHDFQLQSRTFEIGKSEKLFLTVALYPWESSRGADF